MKRQQFSRRSFLATVAGGAAVGPLTVFVPAASAQPGCTDRDPSPPRGDPVNQGRNCRGSDSQPPPRSGCSDSDPTDPSGQGRNCTAGGQQTGCSDNDPSDPMGGGRNCTAGGQQAGCSDSDPTDPSGAGRNCQPGGGNQGGGPLSATIDCNPLTLTISRLPSANCHIMISGWENNGYPVEVSLPQAVDGYGNHANGVQVTGASGSEYVDNWERPVGSPHSWGIFVFACGSQRGTGANCYGSAATPGATFSVPILIKQRNRETTVMLTGRTVPR